MMKLDASVMDKGMERILELSADAHIRRRWVAKESPEYYNLTGAIAAYGKTLELLTALQQWEEYYAMIAEHGVPGEVAVC
ncbi:MAG TPA: hypothetical protein VMR90_07750 [Candidatus Cybelea sp.]|nr:hypothetical protein [Candidatus Cybelea sp.]